MANYYYFILGFILFVLSSCINDKKDIEYPDDPSLLLKGENLYNTYCISCHHLEDQSIGPQLGGITKLFPKDSLVEFIKSPALSLRSTGKGTRNQLSRNNPSMPGFDFLEESQITSILAYINFNSKHSNIDTLVAKAGLKRMAKPIHPSNLIIELKDYVKIPPSGESSIKTRIATMRASPMVKDVLYVSDQRGVIYRIENNNPSVFLDLRGELHDFIDSPGLGTGLGSFEFHPNFKDNKLLYTTHTEKYKGKPADSFYPDTIPVEMQWVVSEWNLKETNYIQNKNSRRELLRLNMPTYSHGIQDIGFAPGLGPNDKDFGMLYIGIGDGGSTGKKYFHLCHNLNSLLGTIIRIDPSEGKGTNSKYIIPTDNPFVEDKNPLTRGEIWAYGFRNPHRFAWETTGEKRMFVTDIGQANIEEINVVEKGEDYGWNIMEGNYKILPGNINNISVVIDKPINYKEPFAQYDHVEGKAISGGYIYNGDLPVLKNKYLFGDIVNGRIFYVNIDSQLSDSTIYETTIKYKGMKKSLRAISNSQRADLRIGYDHIKDEMYIMTKSDGMIRKVVDAYWE